MTQNKTQSTMLQKERAPHCKTKEAHDASKTRALHCKKEEAKTKSTEKK